MNNTKLISIALGTAFVTSMALSNVASASENPFAMKAVSTTQVADAKDGKCGEGKCGGDKKAEGKCGGDKKKDGKCGGDKKAEGKCGGDKKKEGKCGEGKCGANK